MTDTNLKRQVEQSPDSPLPSFVVLLRTAGVVSERSIVDVVVRVQVSVVPGNVIVHVSRLLLGRLMVVVWVLPGHVSTSVTLQTSTRVTLVKVDA